jgi:hypothetical protein
VLKALSFCPYLTSVDVTWRPQDYNAYKMVKAIKGEEFKGYFDVTVAKKKTLRFDNGNAAKFHPIAHQVLARGILTGSLAQSAWYRFRILT